MSDKQHYPKMLFGEGTFDSGFSIGQQLHLIVQDPAEEIQALSNGWFNHQSLDPALNEFDELEQYMDKLEATTQTTPEPTQVPVTPPKRKRGRPRKNPA